MKNVNFIQPIAPKKQEEIMRWFIVSLVGSIVLIFILSSFNFYQIYCFFKIKEHHNTLQTNNIALQIINEKHAQLEKVQDELQKKIEKIEFFAASSQNAKQLLEDLSLLIPEDVLLLHYKQENRTLELVGLAFSTNSIFNFLQALNESTRFKNIRISSMQQETHGALVRFVFKGNQKS